MMIISRNTRTGHAQYKVIDMDTDSQITDSYSEDLDLPTVRPIITRDPRDVPFTLWCETHRHQLRRMLRCMRHRLTPGGQGAGWDWDKIGASLARYVYATSDNRRKTTPSF